MTGNPVVNLQEGKFLSIRKNATSLAVYVDMDRFLLQCLVCSFLKNGHDMHAAVIAPENDREQLAHRIVSFLGAYMRVYDQGALEKEICRCIDECLRRYGY